MCVLQSFYFCRNKDASLQENVLVKISDKLYINKHDHRTVYTLMNASSQRTATTEMAQSASTAQSASLAQSAMPEAAPDWKPLTQSDIGGVQSFLFFVGWPRSCHSIVGSMLDAHRNMIVAHEFFLFQKLDILPAYRNRTELYNRLYKKSNGASEHGWRSSTKTEKGYSLNVDGPESWQGQFSELKVIGDKSGGDACKVYQKSSSNFKNVYRQLRTEVKVPVKVLQVIRNPFDMIATETLFRGATVKGREEKVKASPTNKYRNIGHLKNSMTYVMDLASAMQRMVPDAGLSPHQVHCEDLIADPVGTMSSICQFLEVECSAQYLQMCADKTFKNVSETRYLVEWDLQTKSSLTQRMKQFPFFDRYVF